ncbi:MAG: S41 family peptidase [Treponema sp.]|jgi:carboxyl-terminal processing protease|nr:S41 family peptidase [Treponema sp.]
MDIKHKKSLFKWVWITATVIFCLLFTFALIPGAAAQGNLQLPSGIGNNQNQVRNYTNIMQNVYDFIIRNYVEEVDPRVVFEGAMNGMFGALEDPYSNFLTESDMKDLSDTTEGNFGGVGLNIIKATTPRPDGKPMWVEVVSPIEDTPGWRAGINPGDFITKINGEPTENITMDEVLAILRGTPGESVNLVIRRGEKMEFPVTIVRAIIEVPTVKHAMIGSTGYLKLLTFTPMTAERARDAINDFKEKNYNSLILDLRNNYGGRLDAAVEISNLFLDGGLIVRTRSRISSENHDFNARRSTLVAADIPVIVLINKGSASASEIVAGALKDRGRAYLVGENTFGKGSVQQVHRLSGTGFKITTARYFTPSDVNIDKIGIPPDREVKFPEYTEADAEKLNVLINANKIPEFAEKNPQAASAQIDAFALELEREYKINLSLLRRLIRNELNRTTFAPVYDLEYDVQLQEAMRIFDSRTYQNLMRNSKTLKELQEEAEKNLVLAS